MDAPSQTQSIKDATLKNPYLVEVPEGAENRDPSEKCLISSASPFGRREERLHVYRNLHTPVCQLTMTLFLTVLSLFSLLSQ
jgi:hypothetical protein